jgi:hypothetical protein
MTHIARANGSATWPLLQTVFEVRTLFPVIMLRSCVLMCGAQSILEVFLLCFAGWYVRCRWLATLELVSNVLAQVPREKKYTGQEDPKG